MEPVAIELLRYLAERQWTLSTAESCTGGNIAHQITLIPGSSAAFMGGAVTYSNRSKMDILGVESATLDAYGAVSREVVEQMAEGASRVYHTDCAIATSGIAGPGGGTPDKPVGTVWTALKTPDGVVCECLHLSGNRSEIIEHTTQVMLCKLLDLVKLH